MELYYQAEIIKIVRFIQNPPNLRQERAYSSRQVLTDKEIRTTLSIYRSKSTKNKHTCINAAVGATMPGMDNREVKVILLE